MSWRWVVLPVAIAAIAVVDPPDVALVGLWIVVGVLVVVSRRRTRRSHVRFGAKLAAVTIVGAYLIVVGTEAATARRDLADGTEAMFQAIGHARAGSVDDADDALATASARLERAAGGLDSVFMAPLRAVPAVGTNLDAVSDAAVGAAELADTARRQLLVSDPADWSVETGIPIEDVERLDAGLDVFRTRLDRLREATSARPRFLVGQVSERLDRIDAVLDTAASEVETAAGVIGALPELLGDGTPRRYLIGFLAPAEARAGGGIIGNYSILDVEDGHLSMSEHGRGTDLNPPFDAPLPPPIGPSSYQARWARFQPQRFFQNVTLSPDFVETAQAVLDRFEDVRGERLDGVVTLDPVAVAHLLSVTGPIPVDGLAEPLNAGYAPKLLERDQYLLFTDKAERVDLLERASRATFDAVLGGAAGSLRHVIEGMAPATTGGHVRAYFEDPTSQAVAVDLGIDGALPRPSGDLLAIFSQNAIGNKIDVFLHREIRYDVVLDGQDATGTLTIELTNESPLGGLPDYVIGNQRELPLGTNRSFLTIYSALEPVAASVGGNRVEVEAGRSHDLWIVDIPVQLPPNASTTVAIELRGALPAVEDYELAFIDQHLPNEDVLTVSLQTDGVATELPSRSGARGGVRTFGRPTTHQDHDPSKDEVQS